MGIQTEWRHKVNHAFAAEKNCEEFSGERRMAINNNKSQCQFGGV